MGSGTPLHPVVGAVRKRLPEQGVYLFDTFFFICKPLGRDRPQDFNFLNSILDGTSCHL